MIQLKTFERVAITDAFKRVTRKYFAEKLAYLHQNARYAHNPNLDVMLKVMKHMGTSSGFEMFLTRIKQLPFESFDAVQSTGRVFLKGKTKAMTVDIPKGRRGRGFRPGKYDIGAYGIYVPVDDLLLNSLQNIHFLPDNNTSWKIAGEDEVYFHPRHLHHYGKYYPGEGHIRNPLTYLPSTCWGNFGAILSLNIEAGDLPELFRSLYLFLSVQNVQSPLVGYAVLQHYERIGDE